MKQIAVDNTVKDVMRWASVVGKLAESMLTVNTKHDSVQTALMLKNSTAKKSVIWKNIKKLSIAPQLSPTWVRDVLKEITDDLEIETCTKTTTEFRVPLHKKRACLIALLLASKAKLAKAITIMDHRVSAAKDGIRSANERLALVGDVDISAPLTSDLINDEPDSRYGIDVAVRLAKAGANIEGQSDSAEC